MSHNRTLFSRDAAVCDLPLEGGLDCRGVSLRRRLPIAASALALGLMLAVSAVAPADAADLVRSGAFAGQSDHVTTGTARIERDGARTFLVLSDDFSLDGAPAPTLGFSKGGKFDVSSEFAKLGQLKGGQTYELPASLDTSLYDAVTVWCGDFSVPLGSAPLT